MSMQISMRRKRVHRIGRSYPILKQEVQNSEDLWQHFEAKYIQELWTMSGTVLNDQGKRRSPTRDCSFKGKEARQNREQAKNRKEKRTKVSLKD